MALVIHRLEFLIHALDLLIDALEFFVRGLELFIRSLEFFIRGLELFAHLLKADFIEPEFLFQIRDTLDAVFEIEVGCLDGGVVLLITDKDKQEGVLVFYQSERFHKNAHRMRLSLIANLNRRILDRASILEHFIESRGEWDSEVF